MSSPDTPVTRLDRQRLNGHRGIILWYTGLSGAGKTTLANAVAGRLHQLGLRTFVLDGDNLRQGLCGDLGFSQADRDENIRRAQEVARLFLEAGVVVSAAFISPFRERRDRLRSLVAPADYVEIHCAASLEECERRDTKGLYRSARAGKLANFTGVSDPYQPPLTPELRLDTGRLSLSQCVDEVLRLLEERQVLPAKMGAVQS